MAYPVIDGDGHVTETRILADNARRLYRLASA